MDVHFERILEEYQNKLGFFQKLNDIVMRILNESIAENHMVVNGIESRIKTENSLKGKLELKGKKYRSLDDITDIFGARIITFYNDEVDKVASILEKTFEIDWDNSVDKRKLLQLDQFGYMSIHYICMLPQSICEREECMDLAGMKFEIQVRTALQHIWASIYHDTGYKANVDVPREYLRALNRLSGMLEVADVEFCNVRDDINAYRNKVRSLVKDGCFDEVELNGDSFSNYLKLDPFQKLNQKIAWINHSDIQETSVYRYLEILKMFRMNTLGDVERFKRTYFDDAYKLAANQITGMDLDIISSSIGLHNLCTAYIIRNGGGMAGLKMFYEKLYGERKRNDSAAKRILGLAEKLNIVPVE